MSIEDVIAKLGKPKFTFIGVAGGGYSDQYMFDLSDGRRVVVYVLDGVVSRILTEG